MKFLIGAVFLCFYMGAAGADEPVTLTDAQMDGVTAGFYSFTQIERITIERKTALFDVQTLVTGQSAVAIAEVA